MGSRKLLFLLLGISCLVAAAQETRLGTIAGIVRATNGPLPSVGVLISLKTDQGNILQQITPQGGGSFRFQGLPRGPYYVTVSAPGFQQVTERAELSIDLHVTLSILLVPYESAGATLAPTPRSQEGVACPTAQKEIEKGRKLMEDHQAEKSIPRFHKAIGADPGCGPAYFYLGMAQMDLKKWPEAESSLKKATELDGKLAAAYLLLGAAANAQGKFADAEKPLLRGLELNPETADGQYELARAYWMLNRWQDADPRLKKALALRPEFANAHLLFGNVLLRERDAPGALREFKEYLRLEPNGPAAAETRALVAKIEQALAAPH